MATVVTSKQYSLNLIDLGKGALVSFVSALLTALLQLLQTGAALDMTALKTIGLVALTSGIAYLVKNFFTPEQVVSTAVTPPAPNEPPKI